MCSVGPPMFLSDPADTTVEIFATAVLSCSATSYNNVTITWEKVKHDGEDNSVLPFEAVTNTIELPNNVTSILTITRMAIFYFGQYYCVARNSIGETRSSISNLIQKGKLYANV